jgi:hypothetical protein
MAVRPQKAKFMYNLCLQQIHHLNHVGPLLPLQLMDMLVWAVAESAWLAR